MKTNIQQILGAWDLGFSLDKHTLNSVYLGEDEYGHPRFDTTRSEAGETLYQLKYQSKFENVPLLGEQLYISLSSAFTSASLILPMPASKTRSRQPVTELARDLAARMKIPCVENMLVKNTVTAAMKDIADRSEKIRQLKESFSINDVLENDGVYDALIVDDLFDSGSSLEAATYTLRGYAKIRNVFAVTVTRKRNA